MKSEWETSRETVRTEAFIEALELIDAEIESAVAAVKKQED
jgi:hypothetical protein